MRTTTSGPRARHTWLDEARQRADQPHVHAGDAHRRGWSPPGSSARCWSRAVAVTWPRRRCCSRTPPRRPRSPASWPGPTAAAADLAGDARRFPRAARRRPAGRDPGAGPGRRAGLSGPRRCTRAGWPRSAPRAGRSTSWCGSTSFLGRPGGRPAARGAVRPRPPGQAADRAGSLRGVACGDRAAGRLRERDREAVRPGYRGRLGCVDGRRPAALRDRGGRPVRPRTADARLADWPVRLLAGSYGAVRAAMLDALGTLLRDRTGSHPGRHGEPRLPPFRATCARRVSGWR